MKKNKELSIGKRSLEIALYQFNNPGLSQTAVAEAMGVSVQRVNQVLNSDRVLNAFPLLAKRKVRSLVPKAVGRLEELMNQDLNMAVSEKVVSKILDQADVLSPQPTVVIH